MLITDGNLKADEFKTFYDEALDVQSCCCACDGVTQVFKQRESTALINIKNICSDLFFIIVVSYIIIAVSSLLQIIIRCQCGKKVLLLMAHNKI